VTGINGGHRGIRWEGGLTEGRGRKKEITEGKDIVKKENNGWRGLFRKIITDGKGYKEKV